MTSARSRSVETGYIAQAAGRLMHREQNRNAQRAFRERKEKVLKDLEEKIDDLNKVNDQQSSENKSQYNGNCNLHLTDPVLVADLRELVERLQEENARLQQTQSNQPPAPQSDFTFRSQPSTGPSSSASALTNAPSALSDQDILAFLNQPAPTFPQQPAFTMIQPSAQGSGSSNGSTDDWLWNASTFGTEIPQAIPLGVTNLAETNRTQNNTANSLFPWADFGSNYGANGTGTSPSSANASFSSTGVGASPNFASFLTGYAPSAQTNVPSAQPNSSARIPDTQRSGSAASQGNGTAQRSASTGKANSTSAESPETTCSSSGSDPSDALPATPLSAPFPYVSNPQDGPIDFAAIFGGAAGFGNAKTDPYSFLGQPAVKTESPQPAFFGSVQATTPSGVFDALNYRDPLLRDIDNIAGNQNLASMFANLDGGKTDNFDMNEFLVASPQSQGVASGPSPPAFLHHSSSGSAQSGHDGSTGSVPTIGSDAYARSSSSGHSSSAASPQAGNGAPTQVSLPYSFTYGHPLVQYAKPDAPSGKPRWQEYADKVMQKCKAQMQQGTGSESAVLANDELDNLCKDMQVKASCQEVIRKKIQDSVDSDEQMMKLYNQYLQDGQAKAQSSPFQTQ